MDLKFLEPYIVPLIVVLLLARRLIKNKPNKVKTGRLFIMPLIVLAGTYATLRSSPFPGIVWSVGYLAALAAGGVTGFLTAHHQEFTLDYEKGTVTSRATPIGTILAAALFAARLGMKFLMPDVAGPATSVSSYTPNSPIHHFSPHASATLIGWTNAGIIFSAAMLLARAATTYMRAQPLLAAHKAHVAAKKSGTLTPPPAGDESPNSQDNA